MSCDSTVSNSTNNLEPASHLFPHLRRFWKLLLTWLAGMALGWERRSQYKQILELDDRLLADIGVSRAAVEEVLRSHLYMIAWRDSR